MLLIVPSRYFCGGSFCFKSWCLKYFCAVGALCITEWPPIGKIAAHSVYEMFSWYKYLIVSLVFSHFGFWSGSLFLIAPFPDLCLLVLFIPRHFKKCGVLCYTLRKKFAFECLSVRPSVRPSVRLSVRPSVSASFPCSNLSIYQPIFFKLCIEVYIRKEWFGIEDGQISSNKYRVMALDLL